jgi:hypothetical protein
MHGKRVKFPFPKNGKLSMNRVWESQNNEGIQRPWRRVQKAGKEGPKKKEWLREKHPG